MFTLVIKGQIVSKKNNKQICGRGNRKFIRSSDRYIEWNADAVMQLRRQYHRPPLEKCKVIIRFYYKDRRKRDTDNGSNSVFDTLKDAGVIIDDNWMVVIKHMVEPFYDKENPRVEIDIYNPDEVQNIVF